jgi:hypothetical protein
MINDILEQKLNMSGEFVPGENMFRDFMPAEISVGILTRVPLQGMPIDHYMPGFYKGQMQVIIRHTTRTEGKAMAKKVQSILTVNGGNEIYPPTDERGEVRLIQFIPETLPISFPRLSGGGYEWSQHFQCVFAMK